jgi:integrase
MRYFRRRNKNGTFTYWASWTEDGLTVRRSTRTSDKEAAKLVGARWERERADPVYAASQGATFGVEARMFLASCAAAVKGGFLSEGSLVMYRQKAGTLVRLLGADLRLSLIHGETFAEYLEMRRQDFLENAGKEIQSTTLYKEWVTFRRIMNQAWRAGRFGKDPASLKPEHFGPGYKPRETALTWEQVHKLLAELKPERRAAVAFSLATGARRKEVFAARAGDLDTARWMVKLRGTKTEGSAKTIPVPEPMREVAAMALPPFAPWPNARRGLAAACVRAGVPEVTWNDLRRTFASLLVQGGVSPYVVSKLLRHTTTAMVDLVYGKQTGESLEALLAAQLRSPSVNQTGRKRAASKSTKRTKDMRNADKSGEPGGTRTLDLRIKRAGADSSERLKSRGPVKARARRDPRVTRMALLAGVS